MAKENSHCSSGPVRTLPGSRHPSTGTCDAHQERPAVTRIQGETDSMGCEYIHVCQECLDTILSNQIETKIGCCEWCKNTVELSTTRDYEEGPSGRLYWVCTPCANTMYEYLDNDE